jgi:alkanesulfonate monooxygenase SsuD/methylene tetrahydromethanopterin reductase-like flavin-dependent oxidoreductase (luciferase family)
MAASHTDRTQPKPWIMNAFAMMAPGHLAPGLWRHPDQEPQTLDHWVRLAKFLDEAGFHGIFFADVGQSIHDKHCIEETLTNVNQVLGIYDVYQGNGPALKSGAQIPIQDVALFISALAYATKNLCFGITASTTYENPYALARKFSTLDQLSNGRIGWNIVTSYLESAAKSYGHQELIEHDERYRMAHEFMEVVYKLWEQSWEDHSIEADRKTGVYANPDKVKKINHAG